MKQFSIASAALACALIASAAMAQAPAATTAPPAPGPASAGPASAAAAQPFPTPDPRNFTAASPSVETVNAFLHQLWGYDTNRIWSVAAVLKTAAPGVARVVVYVGDKRAPGKQQQTIFYTLPDGEHALAENVISFGAKPFAAARQTLAARADGPSRGAADKALELVEFADFGNVASKDAQPVMDQLAADFPQAHIVFQSYASAGQTSAAQAAAEGVCVARAKGDAAFGVYARAVFELQQSLTAEGTANALATAATKAGADARAMAACAETQAAKDAVVKSTALGDELGVTAIPALFINGRQLSLSTSPYDALKQVVIFEAGEDGVKVAVQPSLRTLQ